MTAANSAVRAYSEYLITSISQSVIRAFPLYLLEGGMGTCWAMAQLGVLPSLAKTGG